MKYLLFIAFIFGTNSFAMQPSKLLEKKQNKSFDCCQIMSLMSYFCEYSIYQVAVVGAKANEKASQKAQELIVSYMGDDKKNR